MKASRKLDAEVAEKVMGLTVVTHDWPCGRDPECGFYEATHFIPPIGGWFNEKGPVIASNEDGWPPEPSWEEDFGDAVPKDEMSAYVEPVAFYSTAMADAEKVIKRLNELGFDIEVCWSTKGGVEARALDIVAIGDIVADGCGATAPLAICLLALDLLKWVDLTIP